MDKPWDINQENKWRILLLFGGVSAILGGGALLLTFAVSNLPGLLFAIPGSVTASLALVSLALFVTAARRLVVGKAPSIVNYPRYFIGLFIVRLTLLASIVELLLCLLLSAVFARDLVDRILQAIVFLTIVNLLLHLSANIALNLGVLRRAIR